MSEHQDPCTSTTCKCFENGQQQELSDIVAYIKNGDTLERIAKKHICDLTDPPNDPCADCYSKEIIKHLIKGKHRT